MAHYYIANPEDEKLSPSVWGRGLGCGIYQYPRLLDMMPTIPSANPVITTFPVGTVVY